MLHIAITGTNMNEFGTLNFGQLQTCTTHHVFTISYCDSTKCNFFTWVSHNRWKYILLDHKLHKYILWIWTSLGVNHPCRNHIKNTEKIHYI